MKRQYANVAFHPFGLRLKNPTHCTHRDAPTRSVGGWCTLPGSPPHPGGSRAAVLLVDAAVAGPGRV